MKLTIGEITAIIMKTINGHPPSILNNSRRKRLVQFERQMGDALQWELEIPDKPKQPSVDATRYAVKAAEELGVDLEQVASVTKGKITKSDVEAYTELVEPSDEFWAEVEESSGSGAAPNDVSN